MAWSAVTVAMVTEEFTAAEKTVIDGIQGAQATTLTNIVTRAINECRGAIAGGGYPLGAAGTVPEGMHSDVIAVARWRFLIAMPQLAKMQTDKREKAFDAAQKKFERITQQDFAIEPPSDPEAPRSGTWNSENKLVPRTHPVPRAGTQFQGANTGYANPDAPGDET